MEISLTMESELQNVSFDLICFCCRPVFPFFIDTNYIFNVHRPLKTNSKFSRSIHHTHIQYIYCKWYIICRHVMPYINSNQKKRQRESAKRMKSNHKFQTRWSFYCFHTIHRRLSTETNSVCNWNEPLRLQIKTHR